MNPVSQNFLYALGAIVLIAILYEVYKPLGLGLGALAILAIIARV